MSPPKKQTPAARARSGAQDSFLDSEDFTIRLPAPRSQCARIGVAILGGAILNSTDIAHSHLETTKLTSRISDLIIKFGWNFISKSPATRIKGDGRPQRVVFYRVSNDTIQSLLKQSRVKAWLAECRKGGV